MTELQVKYQAYILSEALRYGLEKMQADNILPKIDYTHATKDEIKSRVEYLQNKSIAI